MESQFIVGAKCPVPQLTEVDSDYVTGAVGWDDFKMSLIEQYHAADPEAAELSRQLEAANGKAFGGPVSTEMMQALQCIEGKVAEAGGSTNRESGHRTLAYNKHLQEVWDRWVALRKGRLRTRPECKALYQFVDYEKTTHGLAFRPHDSSLHTKLPAQAFDLSFHLPQGSGDSIEVIACQCNVYRFCVTKDPAHFDRHKPVRVCERDDRRTLGRTPQQVIQQCPAL